MKKTWVIFSVMLFSALSWFPLESREIAKNHNAPRGGCAQCGTPCSKCSPQKKCDNCPCAEPCDENCQCPAGCKGSGCTPGMMKGRKGAAKSAVEDN